MIGIKECVIWGCGNICSDNILSVKYHESQGKFKVIGITSNLPVYEELWGYPFVKKEEIDWTAIDFVVVMAVGKAYAEIKEELREMGIPDGRIWKHNAFQQPTFDTATIPPCGAPSKHQL